MPDMETKYKIAIFAVSALCGFGVYKLLTSSNEPEIELSDTEIAEPPNANNTMKTEKDIDYVVYFKRSAEGTEHGSFTVSLVTDEACLLCKDKDQNLVFKLDGLEERDFEFKDYTHKLANWALAYNKKQEVGTYGARLAGQVGKYLKFLSDLLKYKMSLFLIGAKNHVIISLRDKDLPNYTTGGAKYIEYDNNEQYILLSNIILRYIHQLFVD